MAPATAALVPLATHPVLPAGGQSSAISYISKRTGRQYVVMTAGGSSTMNTAKGDYMVAYALPANK